MAGIYDMAKDLGAALARTDEYQALKRAGDAAAQDRELVELRNRLRGLEDRIEAALRAGRAPEEDVAHSYQETAEELQAKPAFQRFVAAQANFDKIMYRVNETMARGLQEGAASRIILSS
ncbi:MAG: YlbF family regulator [Gemmatimonadetes bacterium]|nr:YlbF family regulator [Gemmatimonadota bacterium]